MGLLRLYSRRTVVQSFTNNTKSLLVKVNSGQSDSFISEEIDSVTNAVENESLKSKLEIPGLWRMFSKTETRALKTMWLVVFGLCSVMFAFQTWDRIQMIWKVPKSAKVKLDFEKSLEFPSVTICPGYAFRTSVIRQVQTEYDTSGCMSGQKYCDWGLAWKVATHSETIIKNCTFKGKNCLPGTEKTGKWSRRLTSLGRCFTYTSSEEMTEGGNSNALDLTIDPVLWDRFSDLVFNGIRVYIHNPSELPLVEISGININQGCTAHYALKVKEYWRVNDVPYYPCTADNNYTQSRCVMKCIYDTTKLMSNSSCGSPFMTEFNVKLCRTRKEISFFVDNFQYLIYNGSMWNWCVRNCPAVCKQRTYTPITRSLGFSMKNESEIGVRVYFADMWVERIVEEWMYNWDEFVSDTGGSLNLFLGVSCYTFIQFLDFSVAVLIQKMKVLLMKTEVLS